MGFLLHKFAHFVHALHLFFLTNSLGPTFIPCPTSIPDSRVKYVNHCDKQPRIRQHYQDSGHPNLRDWLPIVSKISSHCLMPSPKTLLCSLSSYPLRLLKQKQPFWNHSLVQVNNLKKVPFVDIWFHRFFYTLVLS